jgi:hypothetical protein
MRWLAAYITQPPDLALPYKQASCQPRRYFISLSSNNHQAMAAHTDNGPARLQARSIQHICCDTMTCFEYGTLESPKEGVNFK